MFDIETVGIDAQALESGPPNPARVWRRQPIGATGGNPPVQKSRGPRISGSGTRAPRRVSLEEGKRGNEEDENGDRVERDKQNNFSPRHQALKPEEQIKIAGL